MNTSKYDLSAVGAHTRAEVLRRIDILDRYLSDEIGREAAIEAIGLSPTSFSRLLGVWRWSRRPELIGASGRQRRTRIISAAQQEVVESAARLREGEPVKAIVALAQAMGAERGIDMPGDTIIVRELARLRQAVGLRPGGVHDLMLLTSAVDLPVVHPRLMVTASPIMTILVDVGRVPVVLGLALTHDDEPTPALATRAILVAIARAETSRPTPVRDFRMHVGSAAEWRLLAEAIGSAGLPVTSEPFRPRSARALTSLLGMRPAGVRLFPDRTAFPANRRVEKMKSRGEPITIAAAEDLLRRRLAKAFPGKRMVVTNDPEGRGYLAAALLSLQTASDALL